MERNILCIDLKSFFASCECIDRGIDPFSTPLVVANPNQGKGAITLAITPALKNKGIKSRSRLYEIPSYIKYQIVPPRMSLYIKMSQEVINVFLDFIAKDDIHVYSIDESFLDVTEYLSLYKKSDYELAETILEEVTRRTGLTATCGIGPNMLMAKVALDTDAKKYKNGITKWTYDDIPTKLWELKPVSKMWGIGPKTEKKLNAMGIYKIGDLANYDKNILKHRFGINGLELWEHANGIDNSRISDMKVAPKDKSISHSQVLLKDYNMNNIGIIIEEMVDVLVSRLRNNRKMGSTIGFGIGYSMTEGKGFYHHVKLPAPTDDYQTILHNCVTLFERYIEDLPIRKVNISLGKITDNNSLQLDIFNNYEEIVKKDSYHKAVDDIKNKYGKNSILKASALIEDSTIKDRNKKIGGHSE